MLSEFRNSVVERSVVGGPHLICSTSFAESNDQSNESSIIHHVPSFGAGE